ncbi:MAG: hypothetical protein WDM89_19375 [Rhizomicrobium sp.]
MPTARAWAVDKISDTKGNYLTVNYINDTINGQTYPLAIHYTANDAAGLAAYNSVQFIYGTRTDVTAYYQAGSVMKSTVLLSEVQTYAGANEVLDYEISYTPAASGASHDELTTITQCDASSTQRCLAPLTFGWQGSRNVLTYSTVNQSIADSTKTGNPLIAATVVAGDFNGDGLTDALVTPVNNGVPYPPCPPTQGGPFYLGNLAGTSFTATTLQVTDNTQTPPTTGPFCPLRGWMGFGPNQEPVDFSADGKTDLYEVTTISNASFVKAALSSGTSFNIPGYASAGMLADMDGDGRTDILAVGTESLPGGALLSNGDGTFRRNPRTGLAEVACRRLPILTAMVVRTS